MSGIDAHDLRSTMREFAGGSEKRYRHSLNRKFIYTDGVNAVADKAGAYWFLDIVALKMAPLFAKAWLAGEVGVGSVVLEVFGTTTVEHQDLTVGAVLAYKGRALGYRPEAQVTLQLADDTPPAYTEAVPSTDFPVGKWTFLLATDEVGQDEYVTTMCLLEEY